MNLAELPSTEQCFVDANIITYHFTRVDPFSNVCSTFLRRGASGEVSAVVTETVLGEALRKIMLSDAMKAFELPSRPQRLLQNHPHRIAELQNYGAAAHELAGIPFTLAPVDLPLWSSVAQAAAQFSLLTNDALIVAVMERYNISHLAINDDDFDHIPRPDDLEAALNYFYV